MWRFFLITLLISSLFSAPASASWLNQLGNGDSNASYIGVGAAGPSRAAACGYVNTGSSPQVLYATTSTGDSWSEGGGFAGYGAALEFASESVGFIGGLIGKVWRTTDGGASWIELPEATVGGGTMMDSDFVADIAISPDGQTVWVLGASGECAVSDDQGNSWSKVELDLLAGTSITAGALLGDSVWIVGGTSPEEPVEGSDFEDPSPGHPAGDGFVLYSADGGDSFDLLASGLEHQLTEVSFVNPAEGWAAAATYLEGGAAIARTSDGGESWELIQIDGFPDGEVVGVGMGASTVPAGCSFVEFFGREVGVAVCTTATFDSDGSTGLFLSVDGGESWEHQLGYKDSFPNQLIAAGEVIDTAMVDCHRGWLVGEGKIIQRWDNDDADLDCEQGGAPSEDVPEDLAEQDDGSSDGDDCGCTTPGAAAVGPGSLISLILNLFR